MWNYIYRIYQCRIKSKGDCTMLSYDELIELFINAEEDVKAYVVQLLKDSQPTAEHQDQRSNKDQ